MLEEAKLNAEELRKYINYYLVLDLLYPDLINLYV